MYDDKNAVKERVEAMAESIALIREWSKDRSTTSDYLSTPSGVMAFNACVMRLQVIGENVGKLLRDPESLLSKYPTIPWHAIYSLRNLISHEYGNIDEELVVSIINEDIPNLHEVVNAMLQEFQ